MPDAHTAAVEAMAAGIRQAAVEQQRDICSPSRDARAALAALVRSEAVRAALVEVLSATTSAEVGGEPVTDVYRPEGLVVLILAALAPPEAT